MSILKLNAQRLYNGPIANRVMLHQDALTLDLRNADPPYRGTLVTDPIASDNRDISDAQTVRRWIINTHADVPHGASIQCAIKTGSSYFSEANWTDWQPADPAHQIIEHPEHPYLKLKYILTTDDPSKSPKLHSVAVHTETKPNAFSSPLEILDSHNERLITSPFTFGYERRR